MNIFALDYSPSLAAKYHMDVHVVKMILEYGQLLSTCAHIQGVDGSLIPYKRTHVNHPCSIWTRESYDNYVWLLKLLYFTHEEYTYRFHRVHASRAHLPAFLQLQSLMMEALPRAGLTPFKQAMPEEMKAKDPVNGYRNTYFNVKSQMTRAGWKRLRNPPRWFRYYPIRMVKYGSLVLSPDSNLLLQLTP